MKPQTLLSYAAIKLSRLIFVLMLKYLYCYMVLEIKFPHSPTKVRSLKNFHIVLFETVITAFVYCVIFNKIGFLLLGKSCFSRISTLIYKNIKYLI